VDFGPAAQQIQRAFGPAAQQIQRAFEPAMEVMRRSAAILDMLDRTRQVLDSFWERARRSSAWLSSLAPAKVSNLDESLGQYRRRSIDADGHVHAFLRSLIVRHRGGGDPPGHLVSTQPQVTRGPDYRRSFAEIDPAVVLHA